MYVDEKSQEAYNKDSGVGQQIQQDSAKTYDAGAKAQFQEVVKIEPCSSNQCVNGHKWPPQLIVQPCPGCGGPLLLVRMINCPVCNEPNQQIRFRVDHTSQGFGIAALCRGQKGPAESFGIELHPKAAEEVIEKWNPETGRMT